MEREGYCRMALSLTMSTLGLVLFLCCFHGIEHGWIQGASVARPLGCVQSSLCFLVPFIWILYHILTACTVMSKSAPLCTVCAFSERKQVFRDQPSAACRSLERICAAAPLWGCLFGRMQCW